MNAAAIQTTVINMPVVQMNVDPIRASVTLVILEVASNAFTSITLPVL